MSGPDAERRTVRQLPVEMRRGIGRRHAVPLGRLMARLVLGVIGLGGVWLFLHGIPGTH